MIDEIDETSIRFEALNQAVNLWKSSSLAVEEAVWDPVAIVKTAEAFLKFLAPVQAWYTSEEH